MWRDRPSSFGFSALLRGKDRRTQQSDAAQEPPSRPHTILVALTVEPRDRQLLTDLAADNGWDIYLTQDIGEAGSMINRLKAPVALFDRDLPEADWRAAVRTLASAAHEPCIVVSAKRVDDYLWEEVIRNRGYDILSKPLREYEVTRIVGLALSFWVSRAGGHRTFRK